MSIKSLQSLAFELGSIGEQLKLAYYFQGKNTPLKRTDANGRVVCAYCGTDIHRLTDRVIDHIMPQSRGGVGQISEANHKRSTNFNLAVVCNSCNCQKNGLHPIHWFLLRMTTQPEWVQAEYLSRAVLHWITVCDKTVEEAL